MQSILHGSLEAKQEGDVQVQQHSKVIARGKYVHGFEVHKVKPDAVEDYRKAAEIYYTAIKDDPELHVKLTGSWETIVGEQDTFFHILEYENYSGYDMTTKKIRNSDVSAAICAEDAPLPRVSLFPIEPGVRYPADCTPTLRGRSIRASDVSAEPGDLAAMGANLAQGYRGSPEIRGTSGCVVLTGRATAPGPSHVAIP